MPYMAVHGLCMRIIPIKMLRNTIGSSNQCKLWVPSPEETAEFSLQSMEWRRRCMLG